MPELACKTILHVLEIDQEKMVDLYTKKVLCVHCVEERRGEERRGGELYQIPCASPILLPYLPRLRDFVSILIYSFLHWKYTFRYFILISTPTTPWSPPPYIGTCPLLTDSCRFSCSTNRFFENCSISIEQESARILPSPQIKLGGPSQ